MRFYTSVAAFSAEISAVFSTTIGLPIAGDTAEVQAHISSEASSKDTTTEYKEKKKLVKRIIKAIQGSLEDATRKEGELCRKPFEKELRDLDLLLENSFLSRRDSLANSLGGEVSDLEADDQGMVIRRGTPREPRSSDNRDATTNDDIVEGVFDNSSGMTSNIPEVNANYSGSDLRPGPQDMGPGTPLDVYIASVPNKHAAAAHHPTPEDSNATPPTASVHQDPPPPKMAETFAVDQEDKSAQHVEPPTPPLSSEGDLHALSHGGIPWYMEPFDPVGTTIEEERWTGRELVRGMSEELSDMDENELSDLIGKDTSEAVSITADGTLHPESAAVGMKNQRKSAAKRKRSRGYH